MPGICSSSPKVGTELKQSLCTHTPLVGGKKRNMESLGILFQYDINLQINNPARGYIDSKRLKLFTTLNKNYRIPAWLGREKRSWYSGGKTYEEQMKVISL